ncbi:family 78 glycoside hydrolase catalytic domain [Streptomyces sp. NBC_01518]|uniref:family 78 glycoside hydrolase catalytic domain n=1 Tax=Streptomyces sp. NBC_01518 TaxID=2903891 RepID=UPI003869CD38
MRCACSTGFDTRVLFPADTPPVRRIESVEPVTVTTPEPGRHVLDVGQNLVGRLRIRLRGPAGHTVTLRHAEIIEDGGLSAGSLGGAAATDRYTLRGAPDSEIWEPRFTVHGFRYAELDGWPGELVPGAVTAVVIHSDLRRTGWFSCSDASLTQLHENIVWGMRGNFLDLPTDCRQRDERLGWCGDTQVFAPLEAVVFSILRDVRRTGVPIGWSWGDRRIRTGPPEQLVGVESPSSRRPWCSSLACRWPGSPARSPGSVTVWLTGSETPPTTRCVSGGIRRT